MSDLNALVDGSSSVFLLDASDINDRGEITGGAYDPTTGMTPGFVAVPHGRRTAEAHAYRKVDLPESVRMQLKHRRGFRFL